jgi:hypothetical protein
MPYVCDLRSANYNNVIAFSDKLYIEQQEVTPTNLAPVPFSQGPSTVSAIGGQFAMQWVYRRGGGLTAPLSGSLGSTNSALITCGQSAMTDFVQSPVNGLIYGGSNVQNTINQYAADFNLLGLNTITVGSLSEPNVTAGTQTAKTFLPYASSTPADGGWLCVTSYEAQRTESGANNTAFNGGSISKLSETGIVSNIVGLVRCRPTTPYVGSEAVVLFGTPMPGLAAPVNDQNYATKVVVVNRLSGAATMASVNWIPAASIPVSAQYARYCFPSNAIVATPGSEVYFYHPVFTNTSLTIYVGTISNLSGSPTISSIAGNTLTAVGGGALDIAAVVYPAAAPGDGGRQVRLWVTEDAGNRYLNMLVFEPGTGTAVATTATDLYIWQLNSKFTATFLQKVGLSNFGRVRAVLPSDTTQKTIVVVYDTSIAFYSWNSATNWTFLTSQSIQAQEVGIDTNARVWVSSQSDYTSTTPQTLSVFDIAGAASNIVLSFDANRYTYTGTPVSANLIVNAYDVAGNRVALAVTLSRVSTNFSFTGGSSTTNIVTSSSGNTLVPVSITDAGRLLCTAAPT